MRFILNIMIVAVLVNTGFGAANLGHDGMCIHDDRPCDPNSTDELQCCTEDFECVEFVDVAGNNVVRDHE